MRLRLTRMAVALVAIAGVARAHDLGVDVNAAFTQPSEFNPRTGAVGLGVTGAWDLSPSWAVFGLATYTRDLATRTETTASSGSNIFRFSLGVQWLPHPQWMLMLAANGSPPSAQVNATTRVVQEPLTGEPRLVDVVIDSRSSNLGGQLLVAWMSDGDGPVQSTLDFGGAATRFDIVQRLRLPDTPGAQLLRANCERRASEFCQLIEGASTPLWQARLSAGYTATLREKTDLGLDASVFLYDRDPAEVGYFSVVNVGRDELGAGVPVSPLRFTVRPAVTHRFEKFTLRASYQWGLYASDLGVLHTVAAKLTWKVTPAWRLSLSLVGQLDVDATRTFENRGGTAMVGFLHLF
jgi:hypothetical protein